MWNEWLLSCVIALLLTIALLAEQVDRDAAASDDDAAEDLDTTRYMAVLWPMYVLIGVAFSFIMTRICLQRAAWSSNSRHASLDVDNDGDEADLHLYINDSEDEEDSRLMQVRPSDARHNLMYDTPMLVTNVIVVALMLATLILLGARAGGVIASWTPAFVCLLVAQLVWFVFAALYVRCVVRYTGRSCATVPASSSSSSSLEWIKGQGTYTYAFGCCRPIGVVDSAQSGAYEQADMPSWLGDVRYAFWWWQHPRRDTDDNVIPKWVVASDVAYDIALILAYAQVVASTISLYVALEQRDAGATTGAQQAWNASVGTLIAAAVLFCLALLLRILTLLASRTLTNTNKRRGASSSFRGAPFHMLCSLFLCFALVLVVLLVWLINAPSAILLDTEVATTPDERKSLHVIFAPLYAALGVALVYYAVGSLVQWQRGDPVARHSRALAYKAKRRSLFDNQRELVLQSSTDMPAANIRQRNGNITSVPSVHEQSYAAPKFAAPPPQ